VSRAKLITLTASEKRLWEATFAAAFVRLFCEELSLREQHSNTIPPDAPRPTDATMQSDHAEEAESIANTAVAQLRRWRTEGTWPTEHERGAPRRIDTQYIYPPKPGK